MGKRVEEFNKLDIKEQEIILTQLQQPQRKIETYKHDFNSNHIKLGIISDTHIGSKYFNKQILDNSIKIFNKEKVDAIYHCGDVIEGMSNREGHCYELEKIGFTSQIEYAAELLSKYKQPLFFITGNHEEWAKKKSNIGYVVGHDLENKINGSKYLGEYTANIDLGKDVIMRLTHEGNSAYALSYSGQKRINALEGGTKPNIIFNGHLHKMLYMNYRNIHFFEAGAMQNQTSFMAMKGSPAMTGFIVADIYFNKDGINRLTTSMYPYY